MPNDTKIPEIYALAQAREGIVRQSERISDLFLGLTVLFSAVGALILGAGFYLQAPLFALSAIFAFVAALAFALCAWRMAHLGKIIQPIATPAARMRYQPQTSWRRAA